MRKEVQALRKLLKPHGLGVENTVGHGARVIDLTTDRVVAQVHLEDRQSVKGALYVLRQRGFDVKEGSRDGK